MATSKKDKEGKTKTPAKAVVVKKSPKEAFLSSKEDIMLVYEHLKPYMTPTKDAEQDQKNKTVLRQIQVIMRNVYCWMCRMSKLIKEDQEHNDPSSDHITLVLSEQQILREIAKDPQKWIAAYIECKLADSKGKKKQKGSKEQTETPSIVGKLYEAVTLPNHDNMFEILEKRFKGRLPKKDEPQEEEEEEGKEGEPQGEEEEGEEEEEPSAKPSSSSVKKSAAAKFDSLSPSKQKALQALMDLHLNNDD